jgi:hypothetical protein
MKPVARTALGVAAGLLALAALGFAGLSLALRDLDRRVAAALGAGSRVEAIEVGLAAVEARGVSMPAGADWPVDESLRAARVRVAPSWRSLLDDEVRVARIDVEGLALAAFRERGGALRVVPHLLAPPAPPPGASATAPPPRATQARIDAIRAQGASVTLYDASIARPPWPVRLDAVDVTVRDVVAPALDERMPIELVARLQGPERHGRVSLAGWIVPSTRDLELELSLAGIDLLALRPYLVEAGKARLERGALDLTLRANVRENVLHAPGRLVLTDLAFASGPGAKARVLGVPRDVLLAGLRARGGRIELDFTLDGRLDDPRFSLREAISTRVAVALAEELGVSVGGLVGGTLGLGREALEESGRAAGGIGSALERLLPKRR